jgi:hypothetical protein
MAVKRTVKEIEQPSVSETNEKIELHNDRTVYRIEQRVPRGDEMKDTKLEDIRISEALEPEEAAALLAAGKLVAEILDRGGEPPPGVDMENIAEWLGYLQNAIGKLEGPVGYFQ